MWMYCSYYCYFQKLNYQAMFGTSLDPETKMGGEAISSLSLSPQFEYFALQRCKSFVASTSLLC